MVQIFLIHYFAGIGLREQMWLFSTAVPVFLLMSAYLYGLKNEDDIILGHLFLFKRIKTLSLKYYPFVLSVFIYYAITDVAHIVEYAKSVGGELVYLTKFVKPLPGCGHLWFMETLLFCYISMVISSRVKFVGKWFRSGILSILLLIFLICMGFLYRGADFVYIYFYLWTYYNARKINQLSSRLIIYISSVILVIGYFLLSLNYHETFRMGIYIEYFQTCVMAILIIKLFTMLFKNSTNIAIITWMSSISMEFYLIHHLFVFTNPIYISITVTLVLSVMLNFLSQKFINPIFSKSKIVS